MRIGDARRAATVKIAVLEKREETAASFSGTTTAVPTSGYFVQNGLRKVTK